MKIATAPDYFNILWLPHSDGRGNTRALCLIFSLDISALMETMSPQQENSGQSRSASLTGEAKICSLPENKKKMKSLTQRRQSAPSLLISKALTKSRTISRENCLSPITPESCPLVQSFLTPSRMFVAHGHAQLKTGLQTQDRCLLLFTDILLITKAKSSTHFKLKAQARVCEMWTAGCIEDVCEGTMHPDRSFVMGWPTCNCVATFSSVEQKERWLSFLKSRIKEEKEKDDPKTISLKVFAKDVGNCTCAKTLTVSQSDCATEVIHMALQEFGIVGCVKDYQLWVSSRKDDPPYPLIGHEFPFSIKMSHMREKASQVRREEEHIRAQDLPEQLPLDTQCQFTLKPSHVAVRPLTEPPHKPLRRKRSIINWAFWRSSPPSPPPTPGRLFGRPLSAVCEGHALPKPVMDMLVLLFLEGPFTRGIFRRCGSVKACREMRERLNAGADLAPLTCESIFVTAAVFKDFLRHIPGSLLSQDLYEQWVGLMGLAGEREEDKVQAVQRLVELLPKENQLLLRHVLAVLHCIQRHAHHNQMNSFNLSVCIAPSMLWGPIPCSPDVESQGTKKVSEVVRFMIEHCRGVLGDDVTSLFGGFPQKSSDHISDVSSVQLNDSSYDSLENELNDEAESPFQDLQSSVSPFQDLPGRHSPFQDLRGTASPFQDLRGGKGKQENQSRDSVITLSDCDLDQPDPDPTTPPVHLQLPPLLHPLLHPRTSVHQPHPQPPAHRGTSEQDALSHRAARWLRRRSEPAIRYPLSGLAPNLGRHGISVRKTSYDGVMGDSEESLQQDGPTGPGGSEGDGEVERNRHGSQDVLRRKHKLPSPLRLDVSCSSLSSPTTSPSGSSMSSLDSAFSQCSTDCADLSTTIPTLANPTNTAPSAPGSSSPRYPAPSSPRSPVATFPLSHGAVPSPREHCEWSQQKIAHGLHPNTWLKRDRRLSLRQQDKSAWEEEDPQELGGGPNNRPLPSIGDRKVHGIGDPSKKRPNSPPSYQQAVLQIHAPRSPKDKLLTVKELRQLHDQASVRSTGNDITQNTSAVRGSLPQSVFFGQGSAGSDITQQNTSAVRGSLPQSGSPSLTLQRQTSLSLISAVGEGSRRTSIASRRASDPSVSPTSTSHLERLPRQTLAHGTKALVGQSLQDCGVKGSCAEPHHNSMGLEPGPRFCLSTSASLAVRDYFSRTHIDPDSCLRTSQEVSVAIIQGRREWQSRRCSDPSFDDFDQMFFAEESYV